MANFRLIFGMIFLVYGIISIANGITGGQLTVGVFGATNIVSDFIIGTISTAFGLLLLRIR